MPLKVGRTYRDKHTGVVGKATEIITDPGPEGGKPFDKAQLALRPEHVHGSVANEKAKRDAAYHGTAPPVEALDNRWYPEDRLEPVT